MITYVENAIETSLNWPKNSLAADKDDYATFEYNEAETDTRLW